MVHHFGVPPHAGYYSVNLHKDIDFIPEYYCPGRRIRSIPKRVSSALHLQMIHNRFDNELLSINCRIGS